MEAIKLRDGFCWTGIIDDKLRVFDIVMYTEFGTTYNSYVMKTGDLRRQRPGFLTIIWKN